MRLNCNGVESFCDPSDVVSPHAGAKAISMALIDDRAADRGSQSAPWQLPLRQWRARRVGQRRTRFANQAVG